MPRPIGSTAAPVYRHHKGSGQAVVTLGGKDWYLGPHGTKARRAEYDRRVGEWLAAGRSLPGGDGVIVVEVIRAYWTHVKSYYANPTGSDGEIISYPRLSRSGTRPGGTWWSGRSRG